MMILMILLMMILFKAIKHDDVPPFAILNYQGVYNGISFFMRKLGDSSRKTWDFT